MIQNTTEVLAIASRAAYKVQLAIDDAWIALSIATEYPSEAKLKKADVALKAARRAVAEAYKAFNEI